MVGLDSERSRSAWVAMADLGLAAREQRYQWVGCVDAGSFGEVTVAIDLLSDGRKVAIKKQGIPSEAAARELLLYSAASAHPISMFQQCSTISSRALGTDHM